MNKDNRQPGKIDSFFSEIESLKKYIPPINSSGYPFIIIFFLVSLLLSMLSDFLGWLGFILTLWCVYFFRDPERIIPDDQKILVSPADGKILSIKVAKSPENLSDDKQLEMKKVSIFMDVFNVHVNRIPVSGKIVWLKYIPGAFVNASLDKSSEDNERMITKIEISKDIFIYVVQIAGLIARRIKCDLTENQSVKIGERFGIIRFGSRVDVYIPKEFKTNVFEGQISVSGETILADFKNIKSK